MRVLLCLPDQGGCAHYRCRFPGDAARAEGIEVAYTTEFANVTVRHEADGPHVIDLPDPEVDLVVMQRPLRRLNVEMIPILQAKGVRVVVDVDDDFSAIQPGHVAKRFFEPAFNPENNRAHLGRACQLADLVTTTTPALAQRYGGHGRVAVLPNCVPRAMLGTVAERDERTVGWGGFVSTHPGDLNVTHGGVATALRETGARFVNVGDGRGVREALELGDEIEFEATGSVGFGDYPYAVARFTVGIVPLADNAFNAAKSALKGLEYAAVGVPFLASPVPDYRRVAAHGIGTLVKSRHANWRRRVRELLDDPELRAEQGERARAAVLERYVYEDNAWRWVEAWEAALRGRRPGAVAA